MGDNSEVWCEACHAELTILSTRILLILVEVS